MKIDQDPNWEFLFDTAEEFREAIKYASTVKEKEFFTKLRYKILNHPAASNDVLMHDKDNAEGIYILRVSDDFLIGIKNPKYPSTQYQREFAGLFNFLRTDLFPYLGIHITVMEWLRKRNFAGINYNADNDLN